jgi:SAM-dependent methyltransferase
MSDTERAKESRGISEELIYRLCVRGLDAEIGAAKRILDLGCGVGHFGAFLRRQYRGELIGADVVRFDGFQSDSYDRFVEVNLNHPFDAVDGNDYDLIFHPEVIHMIENPRLVIRSAASCLRKGGRLIMTTANPLSLPSVLTLLGRGSFRNFQDGKGRYPMQIVPLVPVDGRRIFQEAGLTVETVDFTDSCKFPGMASRNFQTFLPFLGGKWFSDHYRVVGVKNFEGASLAMNRFAGPSA